MANEPIRVLLADDDEDDRLIFKEAIEQLEVNTMVEMVSDGTELIDKLRQSNGDLPHVIFLDLNMPCKSGIECLTEIRSDEQLNSLSIAIYSTSSSEADIEESFVKGANIYIKKPSDFNALKSILNKVICTNWQYFNSGMNKENFLMSI
ncbi:MAG: response regulator [Cyclobacteriaceae bacterium]